MYGSTALCTDLCPRCSSCRNQDRIDQLKEQKGQLIQHKKSQEIKLTKFMQQLVSARFVYHSLCCFV